MSKERMQRMAIGFVIGMILGCMFTLVANAQTEERVTGFPEISNRYFTTAVYANPMSPQDLALYNALRNNNALRNLTQQTNFTEYNDKSGIIQTNEWRTYLGASRPALLIQQPADSNGRATPVFYASGSDLRIDSLPQQIAQKLQESCPKCPQPPTPSPAPVTPVKPSPIPVLVPNLTTPAEDEEYIPLVAFTLPFVGAGLGLYQSVKKEQSVR